MNEKEILIKALKYIEEHLYEQYLSVWNVAKYVGIDIRLLDEIFARFKFPMPCRCIIILRLEKLEKEIIKNHVDGKFIKSASFAEQIGFNNMVHLTSSLNRIMTMNYREFKKAIIINYRQGNKPLLNEKVYFKSIIDI